MIVFTCTDFTGVWPVGTAAVVVADSVDNAREILSARLVSVGLPPLKDEDELKVVDTGIANSVILCDGDY